MLLRNAKIVTIEDQDSYGLIECGAIAIKNGLIDWVGADEAIPAAYR